MFDLTTEQHDLLLRVHAEHMKYCGNEYKEKYVLGSPHMPIKLTK